MPYNGPNGSHQGQNLYELNEILDFLDTKKDGSPQVIIGDFNVGPNIPDQNIAAEFPENYQVILDNEYVSANTASETTFCTYCPSENLINNEDVGDSSIDHIFVRNAETSNPRRILDDQVTLTNPMGDPVEVHLSDHFGYKATVTYTSN